MKRSLLLLLLASAVAAAPLVPGKHYDFYQDNGQNLLHAELLGETETEFEVKLTYLPRPLKIAKRNLLRPPQLSAGEEIEPRSGKLFWGRTLRLGARFGYAALTTGPLAGIFPAGLQTSLGAEWLLFAEPWLGIRAVSLVGSFVSHTQDSRSIRQYAVQAGPVFALGAWKSAGIDFSLHPLFGVSKTSLTGYTFTADYYVFSGQLLVQAERRVGPVVVGLQIFSNYLFDQSLAFTASGISVGAQYPLFEDQGH